MRRPTDREWTSIALLSVIVPISFLTTFKLTGILPEPPKPETITVEAVTWSMNRPTSTIRVDEWVRNFHMGANAGASSGVHAQEYTENMLGWPSDGNDDVLNLGVVATANLSQGFIHSMVIKFSEIDSNAILNIRESQDSRKLDNLQICGFKPSSKYENEAYIEALSVNQPQNSAIEISALWTFYDQNNQNHWMIIILEITYYNGFSYKKLTIPILIEVLTP